MSVSLAYTQIGLIHSSFEEYNKAIQSHKEAIKIEKSIFGTNHNTTISYSAIGTIYNYLGNYNKALEYYNKVLKLRKIISGKQSIELAASYDNIGSVYLNLRSNNKALEYYNKALKLREFILGKDNIEIASSYDNIGSVYSSLNNDNKALEYYNKALKLREFILGKDNIEIALSYDNIGSVYSSLNNDNKALEYYNKALKLNEFILGKHNRFTLLSYDRVGMTYKDLKKFKKALEYCYKALEIRILSFGNENLSTALAYENIANICDESGCHYEALKYYNITLKLRKSLVGKKHISTSLSYLALGIVCNSLKNYSKGFRSIIISIKIRTELLNINSNLLNKKDNISYQNNLNLYDSILFLFKIMKKYLNELEKEKHPKIISKTYQTWLNYNGSVQDEESLLSIISSYTNDEELLSKIENLKAKQYRLAKLLQDQTSQDTQGIIDKVKEEISEIEIYLAKHIERFKQEQKLNNLNYTEISNNLLVEQVFIDFAFGEDNLYIFVIHLDEAINFIEVSKEDTNLIKEKIRNFRTNITTTISQMTRDSIKTKKEEVNEILKLLYDTLMKKYLNEHIDKYKKLIISQDGLLNQLPFEALYNGEEYLIHKKDITYIASGKEFIRLHRFRDLSNEDLSIDIFADPDYDLKVNTKEDDEDDIGLSSFRTTRALDAFSLCKPLPNTKKEAEAIQKTTQLANLFIEKEADEHNLKSLSNAKILHIATHGMVVENENEQEPLLKCALALTGYNTSIKEKKDYGVFTGLKIASLDLRNTDLVVLSTCESAKGQSDTTEGVASLSRAFMMAGANATIASLWEAHDAMTQQFFTSYYSKLKTQTNYARVFKETQLEMLSKCKEQGIEHPLFWACFCFFGT